MMATVTNSLRIEGRELFRPTEVAQLSSLSRAFIYRLVENGQLESVRIGSAVRIPRREVERLITEGIMASS